MEQLWQSLGACWDSVSVQFPGLTQQLSSLQADVARRLQLGGKGEEVQLGARRFRVARKLGEGGYAFVYLVHELPTPQTPLVPEEPLALKKVLVGTREQLEEAQHEVAVMQQLHHPNLLPLLDSACLQQRLPDGSSRQAVLLLFPAYEGGNLWDLVQQRMQAGGRLPLRDVLSIFVQVCAGLQAMHDKALAHRDVKPHNVLLRSAHSSDSPTAAAAPPAVPPGSATAAAAGVGQYEAVLTDFGSTRPAHVVVRNRSEAVALQEDAERHCSAPYRAPELWDVPSSCTVDERVDVWSLGCLLYYMLHGSSPFEQTANQGGGSLMLAVLNGKVNWPEEGPQHRSSSAAAAGRRPWQPAVRQLVEFCLQPDPAARPSVGDVKQRALQLLSECS